MLGVKNAATNAATLPVRERVTNKGRKLGTPTKASVCARLPEQKSTRKTSPRKKYAASAPRELSLSSDQQKVVDFVLSGKSVFFTGELHLRLKGVLQAPWRDMCMCLCLALYSLAGDRGSEKVYEYACMLEFGSEHSATIPRQISGAVFMLTFIVA